MRKLVVAILVVTHLVITPAAEAQFLQLVTIEAGDIINMSADSEKEVVYCGSIDAADHLKIIDIGTPETPTTLSSVTLGNGPVYRFAKVPGQERIFTFAYDTSSPQGEDTPYFFGELITDSEDRSTITLGGKTYMPAPGARDLATTDNGTTTLIGTKGGGTALDEIRVVNTTNSVPVWEYGVNLGTNAAVNGLKIIGSQVLIAAENATSGRNFQIRSFPDLSVLVGSFVTGKNAYSVTSTPNPNHVLVGTTGSVILMDIQDPTQPTYLAGIDLESNPVWGINTDSWPIVFAVQQTVLYQPVTIHALDFTNPLAPELVSTLEISEGVKAYAFAIINEDPVICVATTGVEVLPSGIKTTSTPKFQSYRYTKETTSSVSDWELYN